MKAQIHLVMLLACRRNSGFLGGGRLSDFGNLQQQPSNSVNPGWPRRRALDHSARMLNGVPSPICWIHELRGRPGCRRQPGPKRWPVLAAATCDNARWAGVWSSSLTTWPNSEFRLLAMTSRTEGRLVRSTTSVFLTKSCQRIPRIIRWQRM